MKYLGGVFFAFLFFSPFLRAEEAVKVRLWHQLIYSHREVQAELLREFEKENPGIKVETLYYESEQLRSMYQSAAQVGGGPDLIYGPSDQVGPFSTMKLIRPMDEFFDPEDLKDFDPLSLIRVDNQLLMVGDNVGNHLALLYNKKLVPHAPQTTDELFEMGRNYKKGFFLVWHMQEPFFFVPWIAGFGGTFMTPDGKPQLDTPAVVNAFEFIKKLKNSSFVPQEADYETANALFKEQKSAMIINGDWSWGDYKKAGIDFGIAPLPKISETGKWPSSLVSAKGYSINANLTADKKETVRKVLQYLLSPHAQLKFTEKVSTFPSRLSARSSPIVLNDPLLKQSEPVIERGTLMPIVPELRAVWDALRTQYQGVLGGSVTPSSAARIAQSEALKQIQTMNEIRKPDFQAVVVQVIFGVLALYLLYLISKQIKPVLADLRGPQRLGYLFLAPAALIVVLVILFPFLYNMTISFSNLGLRTFNDWQITGFQNYTEVLQDNYFYSILWKTILWTFVNLIFHVGLGVLLAVILDQVLPAKPLWRTLLIIPWAVPQYITALTWRGMFNQEFGPINQVLREFLHMEPVQWLSRPTEAFMACILTNVWLGFPFMMMVALGGLQGIPKDLYEAARVDGANAWQRFRHITWPMLQPVLVPAIVLGGIWTFNNLNVIWLVSNGGEPADQTHILVSYVYRSAFNLYRYSTSAALSMIIFGILLGATVLYLRVNKESGTK